MRNELRLTANEQIEDAANGYAEWGDVPMEAKLKIYLAQAKEDEELWESLFNQDEKFDNHGENLMADMLEFGMLEDYVKFRQVFFVNLDAYLSDSISDEFYKTQERFKHNRYGQ
jgi:hypothetical protein